MRVRSLTLVFCLSSFPALLFAADAVASFDVLLTRGDYAGAESFLRGGLKEPSLSLHSRVTMLNDLGDLLREEDRTSEARSCFEQVLATSGISWDQRYSAILGLADVDRLERAWDSSYQRWNEALDIALRHQDKGLESFALRGMGEMWLDRGQTSRAEPLLKRALSLVESDPRARQSHIATAMDSLASAYLVQNKTSMAEDLWSRELQLDRSAYGDYHPQTAVVLGHLAELSSLNGDFSRARDYSRQALSIMERRFPYDSPAVGVAIVGQAIVEQRAGKWQASADLYAKALNILKSAREASGTLQKVAAMYAKVLSQLHRGREAKQVVAEITTFNSK